MPGCYTRPPTFPSDPVCTFPVTLSGSRTPETLHSRIDGLNKANPSMPTRKTIDRAGDQPRRPVGDDEHTSPRRRCRLPGVDVPGVDAMGRRLRLRPGPAGPMALPTWADLPFGLDPSCH